MERKGAKPEDKKTPDNANNVSADTGINYEKESGKVDAFLEQQKKLIDAMSGAKPEHIDSAEKDNVVVLEDDDKGPAFSEPEDRASNPLQNFPKEFYEKQAAFAPAIEVKNEHRDKNKADFSKLSQAQKLAIISGELAKPASQQDLSMLDESMIMDLPQIKAASFEMMDMMNPKPKDPAIRFKWANYKNNPSWNLARYYALGFRTAELDDVDLKKTPVDQSMIDGTQIKTFDVILLKIPVMRLMELYKSNIMRSLVKLGRYKERGIAEANRQFRSDISNEPGAVREYNKMKEALNGREPVEFFFPEDVAASK